MNAERHGPKTEQLELGFEPAATAAPRRPEPAREARARWWFAQIYRLIQHAAGAAPPARPEQGRLALVSGRRVVWPERGRNPRLMPVWQS